MFSLLSFFRKKKIGQPGSLEFLGVDIHSHLVPGVDDGAQNIEQSLQLVEGLYRLGFRTLITTPHIRPEYFPNTPAALLERFAGLQQAVADKYPDLFLACAAEYFVDYEFLEYMEAEPLLTFSGNKVLIELSTISAPLNLEQILFSLRLKGLQPILAHPERYGYFDMKDFERIRELGCEFQINLLSLVNHYGTETRQRAEKLIEGGMIDFFGTDCHRADHLEVILEMTAMAKLMKRLHKAAPRNLELMAKPSSTFD